MHTDTGASGAFILQYCEGFPLRDGGCGKITILAQWRQLELVKNLYHETLFYSSAIATNAAKPLLNFIASALNAQPPQRKR